MTSNYKNPYHIDPDIESSSFPRKSLSKKLFSWLLDKEEISCISIVAERGMGAPASISQVLREQATNLPYRIVECDVKTHLGHGKCAADFYRSLIGFLQDQERLSNLPDPAYRATVHLISSTSDNLNDLRIDLLTFFEALHKSGQPLLLVFYSFDRLPNYFTFHDEMDWNLLREFHNNPKLRIYYLIVSRRSLSYVERQHSLGKSLFSTIFPLTYRVGLLSVQQARALIKEPGKSILGNSLWNDDLTEQIFIWGGRNPFCTRYICFELFNRISDLQRRLSGSDLFGVYQELLVGLHPYFDRLYENLEEDGLIQPLIRAVEEGYAASQASKITELVLLGYFLPEQAREKIYIPFSPIFHNYLYERGDLKSGVAFVPPSLQGGIDPNEGVAGEGIGIQDERPVGQPGLPAPLTETELKVLRLLAGGLSNPEIGDELVVSVNTVKKHVSNIFGKLGVGGRVEAVNRARELQLL